jgi:class 3 adenylate cyclase
VNAPQVRYCKTSDGVNIAYTVSGSGPPLVFITEGAVSHAELEWTQPVFGRLLRRIAERVTLVRFDPRRAGLSDRGISYSDTPYLDVEAVVDRLSLSNFDLVGVQTGAPGAIMFAAVFPEKVRHLVVVDGFLRVADILGTPQVQAMTAAATADFTMATEAIGAAAFGVGREESTNYGEYIRKCIDPDFFDPSVFSDELPDASTHAANVKAPTLVLRHGGLQYTTMEMAREVAAAIPDSRLATIDGMWADNVERLADRILDFVLETEDEPLVVDEDPEADLPSGTAVILFTDIADSTALTERMGDAAFREAARALDAEMREAIRERGGTPVEGKVLGDGVMAVFESAAQAIAAGRGCAELSEASDLKLHVGLHAGDVIREEGNVYGGAVNVAARVCGLSAPGEVLLSDIVRGLARTSADVPFEDRGERELKGVGEPVRVWAVRKGNKD